MRKRYRYALGAAAARTGDEMSGPALLLTGMAVTGSASTGSTLLAAITIAAAVGGPLLGVLLDRTRRPGRLLAWALTLYASALVVIQLTLGHVPLTAAVLVAVGAGLLGPALTGGWTAQLPRVVHPGELPRATALDAMTFNLAGLTGPALAGLAGAHTGVIVSATLIVLALPTTRMISTPHPPPAAHTPPAARVAVGVRGVVGGCGAAVVEGFRAIVRGRVLLRATTTSVISCAGQGMLMASAPLLGARAFGSPDHGALLLSGIAASALVANVALARRTRPIVPDTILWSSTLVLAVALLLAATVHPILVLVAAAVAGLAEGPQLTALFAVRHREAPEGLRGQIFITGASLKITGFALGAAVAGPIAVRSLPAALLTAAAVQLIAVLNYAWCTRRMSGTSALASR
ncbi:MFS transporter [Spirillospora sp. NPDC048911]|uniref:MFS transporter n=1 Tax=Spirillospora sp. NPDC048911 TaxID=3364527 RepID=UPI00371236A9